MLPVSCGRTGGHTEQSVPALVQALWALKPALGNLAAESKLTAAPCSEAQGGLQEGRNCAPHPPPALSLLLLLSSVRWPQERPEEVRALCWGRGPVQHGSGLGTCRWWAPSSVCWSRLFRRLFSVHIKMKIVYIPFDSPVLLDNVQGCLVL